MLAIIYIYIYIYIYYIYIYNLNIKGQSEHVTFLDLDITMEDNVFAYLYISFLTKETSFLSLLWVYFFCRAIFHHQYSVIQYFQSSGK